MGAIASQITSLPVVYSIVHSGADQRKHQSSASLAFVRGIHRWPVNSLHKWPVTRKMFPFDDVIMTYNLSSGSSNTTDYSLMEINCHESNHGLHKLLRNIRYFPNTKGHCGVLISTHGIYFLGASTTASGWVVKRFSEEAESDILRAIDCSKPQLAPLTALLRPGLRLRNSLCRRKWGRLRWFISSRISASSLCISCRRPVGGSWCAGAWWTAIYGSVSGTR